MTASTHPSDRLHQRIVRWQQGETEGVLDDEALVEAAQLWWAEVAAAGDELVNRALHLLAWLHWARSKCGPRNERQNEQQWALGLFHVLWQRTPATPPQRIQEYFRRHKPPTIGNTTAHASGLLRSIAAHTLTRHSDTGIRLFALAEWPPNLTADAAPELMQVATALANRHTETGNAADLDAAISYGERSLDIAAEPDSLRAQLSQNVALLYGRRFEQTSAMADIDRSLALTDEALTITRALAADPAELLANRSTARWRRFVAFRHLDDLRHAVADGTAAVGALPPGSAQATVRAHVTHFSQVLLLYPDNPKTGAADQVNLLRAALADATGDAKETLKKSLGVALIAGHDQSQRIEDLHEAVRLFSDIPSGLATTKLLAVALQARFDVLGDVADLDECIALYRRAENSATHTVERISMAEKLADVLEIEYEVRPDLARLHAAIDVGRTAVLAAWPEPTASAPDPDLLRVLQSLAEENMRRRLRAVDRTGDYDFVLSAEAMTDAAYLWWLSQRPTARDPKSPSSTEARQVLGNFHIRRHNARVGSGRPDDLAQMLMLWLPVPEAIPDNLPDPLDRILGPRANPRWQARYANTLIVHAFRDWSRALANAAILLMSAAVEATLADEPDLPERLGRLSDAYLIRGFHAEDTGDLDVAVQLAAESMALAQADTAVHRERLARARSLRLRFARRRATPDPVRRSAGRPAIRKEDVDGPRGAAIAAVMDTAVEEFFRTDRAKELVIYQQSSQFLEEFCRDGLAVSLELALRTAEAETLRHEAPAERLVALSHLSDIHLERYLLTREHTELVEAARLLEEGLDQAPRMGVFRWPLLSRLIRIYHQNAEATGAQLERISHLARTMFTDAMSSLIALHGVGSLALRHQRYDLAVTCYRQAVALMRFAALEEVDRVDRAARLTQISEVGSEAVTAHILAGDPATALEAAEEARAVLLSLDLDLRSDLSKLRETRPDLAERFDHLRQAIAADRMESADGPDGYVRTVRGSQRRDAWAHLLDDIHAVPGHENFLRPPVASELTALNLPGPIILINVSQFGSHALIVGPTSDVRALPLDGLDHDDVRAHAYNLLSTAAAGVTAEILAWLWTAVVGPILEDTQASRVWWVPTGLLTAFPLHAAAAPDGRSALDLVESSYAPTIRLLARAATRGSAPRPGGDLIVAVRRTTNGSELSGAEAEGRALAERFPQAVSLINDGATRERVLAELPAASRVYFACHNIRNYIWPHLSGLGLVDGLLTIDDLSRLDLPNAEFAQLSACATVTPTPDAPDELTHLAATLQIAGFRSVVATLWPVRDLIAAEFSQLFHDAGGDAAAPAALALAVRALRDRHPGHPDLWAAFLHYGL